MKRKTRIRIQQFCDDQGVTELVLSSDDAIKVISYLCDAINHITPLKSTIVLQFVAEKEKQFSACLPYVRVIRMTSLLSLDVVKMPYNLYNPDPQKEQEKIDRLMKIEHDDKYE